MSLTHCKGRGHTTTLLVRDGSFSKKKIVMHIPSVDIIEQHIFWSFQAENFRFFFVFRGFPFIGKFGKEFTRDGLI